MDEKNQQNGYEMLLLENQLCFPLYAAARRVIALYTPVLKKLGITYTQYIIFMVLWEHENITVGDLCRKLYLDSGTVTPILKKLGNDGYITRDRAAEDERVVVIRLTEKGTQLKECAKTIPETVGACIPLAQEDAVMLYGLLYKLLNEL